MILSLSRLGLCYACSHSGHIRALETMSTWSMGRLCKGHMILMEMFLLSLDVLLAFFERLDIVRNYYLVGPIGSPIDCERVHSE